MSEKDLIKARQSAAEIIKKVLKNEISPDEARNRWPIHKDDPSLDVAFHLLYHFEDDEDIRKKDIKYAEWQITQFQEIIKCFEHGDGLGEELLKWGTPVESRNKKGT